ncbi:aminopeptidase P family protein [uncultured Desulfobacter sp.]|uniref:aminopeptidase P family protein n=1 Tax=uncultured Desulfobacter sp. TaxID=240139 RepID=UPI002AABAF9F|nr:aminopeptidase P family protein [uncultured Desulfobacter sp.]
MKLLKTQDKLCALRKKMDTAGVTAVIIPNADPHQSEYLAGYWQILKWLTGFSGSAGTAVVTKNQAGMWTDFRYWIQAGAQLDGVQLFRQGDTGVPSFDKWLTDTLSVNDRIALDGKIVSASQAGSLKEKFMQKGIVVDTTMDLISDLWQDRPPMPRTPAFELDSIYAGETRKEKISRIRKKMADYNTDCHVLAALDDIAWTFNLRGQDIHTNPVNMAFSLITMDKINLFIDPAKVNTPLRTALEADGVALFDYNFFYETIQKLDKKSRVLLDTEKVSDFIYQAVKKRSDITEAPNPSAMLKCLKNEVEISHIRDTAVKDGRAVVNFLHWLCTSDTPKTEISAAQQLLNFRKEQNAFLHPSFDSIMAFKEHSAICHYSADPDTDLPLSPDAMFLTDSGGNYLTGTTDITRTVHLGTPSSQEIRDYTLVLKAHIAVATALFPSTARGYQIDAMARRHLWQQGLDFGHGTGHGVGFFLCVHEGPARLSSLPVDIALRPGMLLTNEPGLYREGQYGIRLENMVLVVKERETQFGSFLKFENMTLCHFERDLVDKTMLGAEEISWVNEYHQMVYDRLSPGLAEPVREWLGSRTRPL